MNNVSVLCKHPLNQRHADRVIPADGERPEIPSEIFLNIIQFLPPSEAFKVQTLCKSQTFNYRFEDQRFLMSQQTKLNAATLKQYQKIFTLEHAPWKAAVGNAPRLCPFAELIRGRKLNFGKVEILDISQYKELSCLDLMAILEQCPNLSSIDLSFCSQLSDAVLSTIVIHCPKVSTINMTACTGFTNEGIKAFAEKQLNMRSVTFPRGVSQDAVIALAKNSPGLEKFHMWSTSNMDYAIVLNTLGQNCPHLRNIGVGENEVTGSRITDEMLIPFVRRYPQLNYLYLNCKNITDDSVIAIAQNCHQLIDLCIESPEITDAALIPLAQSCRELDSLDLLSFHATDNTINAFAANCPSITHLFVHRCTKITSRSIVEFARTHPNLRSITFSREVGDEAFDALAQHCPNARYI